VVYQGLTNLLVRVRRPCPGPGGGSRAGEGGSSRGGGGGGARGREEAGEGARWRRGALLVSTHMDTVFTS